MIVKARNIAKNFKDISVLQSVNLSVEEGEVISIQGSSGSGKTTLLNILGLLDKASDGSIEYYNNLEYDNFNSIDRVTSIGYIFQFHHLLSEFKIIDNLIIPQLLTGKTYLESTNYAKKILNSIDLGYLCDRYPYEISGGECQRVAVLRGIVNQPKIVFADEPTGNLDNENSLSIIKLLDQMRKEFNISFVIATHDKQITKISDKSFYITNGKLVEK